MMSEPARSVDTGTPPRGHPARRTAAQVRLTRGLLILTGLLLSAGVAAVWLGPAPLGDPFDLFPGSTALWALAFAGVGWVIARHEPDNAIGWLLLAAGTLAAAMFLAAQLATTVAGAGLLDQRGEGSVEAFRSLPRSAVVLLMAQLSVWTLMEAALFLAVLLFPDGRLPSQRWRSVAWLLAVVAVLFSATAMIGGPLVHAGRISFEAMDLAQTVLLVPFNLGWLLVLVAMSLRFRRSTGEQRLQLKWLLYVLAIVVAGALVWLVGEVILGASPLPRWISWLLLPLAVLAFPAAIAVAILRYRLYDIDLVINRTLVYATLSVLLGTVYIAGVVLVPRLARLGEDSDLSVAASTLAVVALFAPLRRRIQILVDRRFYRSRYDAQRTVEAFSVHLRDNISLDQLETSLVAVVARTLRPASVGLLMPRPPSEPR